MHRKLAFSGILWALMAASASAQEAPPAQDAGTHKAHGAALFSQIVIEAGFVHEDGGRWTWEVDGWVGGDSERIWLRSEGEITDGKADHAEAQAFYGWNFHPFWDVLAGIRQDFEPDGETWLAAGAARWSGPSRRSRARLRDGQ